MRERQTSLPRGLTKHNGAPSSSNGFSVGLPPIGQRSFDPNSPNARKQYKFNTFSQTSGVIPNTLLAANPMRAYVAIQNNGLVNIFVSFGSTPNLDGTNSLILPPNTGITFEAGIVPNNPVTVVSSVGAQVTVIEGVEI